ncbi:hypothetical protein AUP68_11392, partial [Ilyonectria robusta]
MAADVGEFKLIVHHGAREALDQALCFLCDELETRATASDAFPPEISFSHIRAAVARYEDQISAAAERGVCCSCGKFVPITDIYRAENGDPMLQPLEGALDNCGWHGSTWDVCSSCHAALSRETIPKFSAKNLVNVTLCQHYPSPLEGLTLAEEYLIAKCHPLGVILKLRPGGHSSPVNYHALRGHFIVIPQDPEPLLQILPSPDLRLHNLIRVFWLGGRPPADADLNQFLLVRKVKVLAALQYLVRHNCLYGDLTINYAMIDEWSDDFIPSELRDNIICLGESDHHEREGYTVNLQAGNYENDLQAAQDEGFNNSDDGGPLMTGSVSTDINGERQDPNIRTLDTLFSIVANRPAAPRDRNSARNEIVDMPPLNHQRVPAISYTVRGQTTLVNHWTDSRYFTAAFPTLFPTGTGGHLDQRAVPVSLEAFAEWALSHHSRSPWVFRPEAKDARRDSRFNRTSILGTPLRLRMPQSHGLEFSARMIRYLESTIMQGVDESIPLDPEVSLPSVAPSTKELESDDDYHLKLSHDSNSVAGRKQLHSRNHLSTCFKYRQTGSGKNTCRFGMPRDLVPTSRVDEFGLIHLARNHGWINPWNPAIASCVRSNQDISWIPTVSKSLSLIYYITNYATKDDVSPWQMVAKAALLKQSIERAKVAEPPTATDVRLREKGMDNFALRCFNTLSHDREISGVQVASTLLRLPTYYTINYNFVRVNLWWLRRYVRAIVQPGSPAGANSSGPMGEEPCAYEAGDTAPVSIFDNYKWRGPHLAPLALFEYCMLVRTMYIREAIAEDVEYDPNHPRCATHVQRLARTPSQVATVAFNGQLTEFQAAEDSVPGGHPKTAAIVNDMAEILLGLFVPWDNLLSLFRRYATTRDACAQVWAAVEPTLPPHNRCFAANIELLRKSKEDCEIDSKLWKSADHAGHSLDPDADDVGPVYFGSDIEEDEEFFHARDESFSAETLIAAYHSITKAWDREALMTGRRIPALARGTTRTQGLLMQNLRPLIISNTPAYESSSLRFLPSSTLHGWESRLKSLAKFGEKGITTPAATGSGFEFDDFNLEIGNGIIHPVLTGLDMIPAVADRQCRVGEKPTGASLASILSEHVPLNRKQRLVVERVLSEALAWGDRAYDTSKRQQTLLYVGGEGGVGKSQVIKGIVAGMDLIRRKDEVILMAPTGAAADNIGGNTYHTSLGISINRSRGSAMKPRVRRLWSRKTIMIIDEVSMVDLSTLSMVDNHCKIARSLDRTSTDFFGGLPIVILMGDFFQFPPVRGPALWKEPRTGNNEDENGRLIWHQFKQVIILNEQMRQSEDASFRDFLSRARAATLTEDDLALLNSKVITSLAAPQLEDTTTVVKLNSLRHQVNRIRMELFAHSRSQKIYVFPALHTRTKSTGTMNLRLRADNLLQLPDQGTKIPFPGLFLYTLNMPAVILTNACTLIGQVNGAAGTAIGVGVDPT